VHQVVAGACLWGSANLTGAAWTSNVEQYEELIHRDPSNIVSGKAIDLTQLATLFDLGSLGVPDVVLAADQPDEYT